MSKVHLRKIVIGEQTYLWKFTPGYEKDAGERWSCHDIFVAYSQQNKHSSLQVHFLTWESPVDGGPLRTGKPLRLSNPNTGRINLYEPKFAAQIIQQGLSRGWEPSDGKSLVIEDGIGLLAEIGYRVQ